MKKLVFVALTTLLLYRLSANAQLHQPTADELRAYAHTLSASGEVIRIGSGGLTIQGESLTGMSVRRPGDAIARAAELTMEEAGRTKNVSDVMKAWALWAGIDDHKSIIPYLRMFSEGTDAFATFCKASLAECYEKAGDGESAHFLFQSFDRLPKDDPSSAYALACASRFYLSQGDTRKAAELATQALALSDQNIFQGGGHDPFAIARTVLKSIPGSTLPDASHQGAARTDHLETAKTALAAKDFEGAIKAHLEHRRLFPNEPSARSSLLAAAEICQTLQQTERALAMYEEAEIQYGSDPEGWKAALAAGQILESKGDANGSLQRLKASLQRARTPEASAWITSALASACTSNRMPDEAAGYYIDLLTKYANQDASRAILENLESSASQIKDWKKLARRLQQEIASSQVGFQKRELSLLRRLVLGLYITNEEGRAALTWIKSLRTPQDAVEAEWIRKDEAWTQASMAQAALEQIRPLSTREFADAVDSGLIAWNLAGPTEEGLAGLRAAQALSISPSAPKRPNRSLESALKQLLETQYRDEARSLLAAWYEYNGDKRGLQTLP